MKLKGCITALATPFKQGEVDFDALKKLVAYQLDNGIHGLLPLGSTGEAATITFEERTKIIKTVISEVASEVPVIVGAGSNSTAASIPLVKQAKELGADAALVVTPYYNKPNIKGLYAHYKTIGEAVDIPIIVYNVPGRTGLNLLPEMAEQLAELPFIIGFKEAAGSMQQIQKLIWNKSRDYSIMSGEDILYYATLAAGGNGLISVTSNVAPKISAEIYNLYQAGEAKEALILQQKLARLIGLMFIEINPTPLKAALNMLGLMENELRLPLVCMDDKYIEPLKTTLESMSLI